MALGAGTVSKIVGIIGGVLVAVALLNFATFGVISLCIGGDVGTGVVHKLTRIFTNFEFKNSNAPVEFLCHNL